MTTSGRVLAYVSTTLLLYAVVGRASVSELEAPPFNITLVAPKGCTGHECKLSLTVVPVSDGFEFSLHAENKAFAAVALAESAMMGTDKVIECVVGANESQPIEVYHSTNGGPPLSPNRSNTRDSKQDIDSVATNITGGWKDGHIFCSFMLKANAKFPDYSNVDLTKSRYYLQVVAGDHMKKNNTGIGHHNMWATTLRAVSLTKDEGVVGAANNVESSALKLSSSWWLLTVMLIAKAWQ